MLRENEDDHDSQILFCGLPDIESVAKFDHGTLIEVLRRCPVSEYFGQTRVNLNCKTFSLSQARSIVRKMIKGEYLRVEVISEASS